MVILKCIPLGPRGNILAGRNRHNHLVLIDHSAKPCAVPIPHLCELLVDIHFPLVFDAFDELLSVRRVTNTLEEFDSLLALELLKSSILLNELLLIPRQLNVFQI